MSRRPKKLQHGIKLGQICDWPDGASSPAEVAAMVKDTGSPLHKSYPSPAGAPALRSDKEKCDVYDQHDWPKLLKALREAIAAKVVADFDGEFPTWAWVWINDVLHKARLTNAGVGDYHGFPVRDPAQYPTPLERIKDAPRVTIPGP